MYEICTVGPSSAPPRMPETFVSPYRTELPSFQKFTEHLARPPTPPTRPPSAVTSNTLTSVPSNPDETHASIQFSIATLVNPAPPNEPANERPAAGTPAVLPPVGGTPSPTAASSPPQQKASRWPKPQAAAAAPPIYLRELLPNPHSTTPAGGDRQHYRPPPLAPAVNDVNLPLGWGYIEALFNLNQASVSLFDFSKRFYEQCQREPVAAPEGGATISAQLPSRQMVSQMANNAATIKKKLEEIAHIVKRVAEMQREDEEEAAAAAAAAAAAGTVEGGGGGREVERRESTASTTTTTTTVGAGSDVGGGRARSEDGEPGAEAKVGKAQGWACRVSKIRTRSRRMPNAKKTIPARNAAGRCHGCGDTVSTEWRTGPDGKGTLCNRCGLQFSKASKLNALRQQALVG